MVLFTLSYELLPYFTLSDALIGNIIVNWVIWIITFKHKLDVFYTQFCLKRLTLQKLSIKKVIYSILPLTRSYKQSFY